MTQSFQIGAKGIICADGCILLLRDPRIWDLPGGRIDRDESPLDALTRELREELPGINEISIGHLVGWHHARSVTPKAGHSLMLFVFLVEATLPDPIVLSEEHTSAHWSPIETAISLCPQLSNVDWRFVQNHHT